MDSIAERYQHDYREHAGTRAENDRNLLPRLTQISAGDDIESLERFAKGYLGMFLDLDNTIPPKQRISILANPALAQAIEAGFAAILTKGEFPNPQQIADSMLDEKPIAIGYVLLAALDRFSDDPRFQVESLSDNTIIAAVCCHYAYKTELFDRWLTGVLQSRQQQVAQALVAFWGELARRNTNHLPGLYEIISHQKNDVICRQVVLPILQTWKTCRKSTLRDVLHAALRVADHQDLLRICETALETWNNAEPARYILWLATAFLLAPEKYDMVLSDYTGRSMEKVLPLLDFTVMVLLTDNQQRLQLKADAYTHLIRIIAAKMAPQYDRYNNLCDNTQKVMYLFYRLVTCPDTDTPAAIKRLGMVRVMKLYQSILDYVVEVHGQPIEFESFLTNLINGNRIKARLKWSDLGH
jgi:hypothetical protein